MGPRLMGFRRTAAHLFAIIVSGGIFGTPPRRSEVLNYRGRFFA